MKVQQVFRSVVLFTLAVSLSSCGMFGFKTTEKSRAAGAAGGSDATTRDETSAVVAQLDTAYGLQGKIVTSITNRWDMPAGLAQQSVGANASKVVVAGMSHNPADFTKYYDVVLTRYDSKGTLDRTFGGTGDGFVRRQFASGRGGFVTSIKVMADDSIMVAGAYDSVSTGLDFFLMKFSASGVYNWIATVNFSINGINRNDSVAAMAVDASQRIWLVGQSAEAGGRAQMAVARYLSSGALDSSFDSDGKALYDVVPAANSVASAIAFQGTNAIIGGHASNGNNADMAAIRVSASGVRDLNFGSAGKLQFDLGWSKDDHATSVLVQADNKIVLGGDTSNGNDMDFALVRFDSNGALDSTFGTNGRLVMQFERDDHMTALTQVGDRLFASGYVLKGNFYSFAAAMVTANGVVETKVTVDFGNFVSSFGRAALALSDGILVAGESYQGSSQFDFSLAKLKKL